MLLLAVYLYIHILQIDRMIDVSVSLYILYIYNKLLKLDQAIKTICIIGAVYLSVYLAHHLSRVFGSSRLLYEGEP